MNEAIGDGVELSNVTNDLEALFINELLNKSVSAEGNTHTNITVSCERG